MQTFVKGGLLLIAASMAAPAQAQDTEMGRYMPLFPGMYFTGGYAEDDRDSSYAPDGSEQNTAVPTLGTATAFPQQRYDGTFTWHFPMFESQHLPFFSSRTHLARVSFSYVRTQTEGGLAAFNASERGQDKDIDEADDLRNGSSGIGDMLLEFGSYLYGSSTPGWRTRERTPLAVLALLGLNVPYGVYERDSASNGGSNTGAFQGKLAVHWQPWTGAFVDAAYGYRAYLKNQDPAYGALVPTHQGDDRLWDLSFGHRLWPGLYASAFVTDREGEPNGYLNPRFAPNAPPPPDAQSDAYPVPGRYKDQGTALRSAGATLQFFITQRWLAALSYTWPQSGRSGQFDLPFNNRTPAGCTPGALSCQVSEGRTVTVDGQGPARSFASDSWRFTLSYNFGQGDPFTCTGCE